MVKEVKNKLCQVNTKLKEFASSNKFVLAGQKALIGAGFFILTPLCAFADVGDPVNPIEMVTKLVSLVCSIFGLIGAVLLVWALGQLILAFKNEDADSKSRAMQVLIVAVLLCAIGLIYKAVTGTEVEKFDFTM